MIEKIEVYQTNDGCRYDSRLEAEAHILCVLENNVGDLIDSVSSGLRVDQQLCTVAKRTLVDALVGSIDNARVLRDMLTLIN